MPTKNVGVLQDAYDGLSTSLTDGRTAVIALGVFAVITGLAIYYIRKIARAGKA